MQPSVGGWRTISWMLDYLVESRLPVISMAHCSSLQVTHMAFHSLMVSRAFYLLILSLFLQQTALAQEKASLFSGVDITTGKQITLEDYRGKVVFIDFWASWCPPCLLSLPAYDRMRKDIGVKEFEIIAINVDENTSDGLEFLSEHPVSYPVLADPVGTIGIPYEIRTLPRSFLLDRKGNIIATHYSFNTGDDLKLKKEIETILGL